MIDAILTVCGLFAVLILAVLLPEAMSFGNYMINCARRWFW